ncbi:MAG: Holliday junction resolvase RuvX [Prevotellaceae bacterium]|jgi:putative Holliday junction resolvase|nr:Holliday junction resolvase RuvX [Prevotellaceae bacterium]
MSRILSIDYGSKRTGIAVSDPLQIIAGALTTIETPNLIFFLKDYFSKEKVEKIVFGYPKHLNNQPADIVKDIEKICNKIKEEFPNVAIDFIDERFTSKIAFNTMIKSGINKKQRQNKALIDKIAATIILEDYLNEQ